MLQSDKLHQWSPDGVIWETPSYIGVKEWHGGSKASFPKDGRSYLSFWGSTKGETGGCCVSTYGGNPQHWRLAFRLFYQGIFTFLLLIEESCMVQCHCFTFDEKFVYRNFYRFKLATW